MDTLSPYSQNRWRSMYEQAWISSLVRRLAMNSETCQSFSRSRNQSRRINIPLTTVRHNTVTFTFYSHSKGTVVPVQAMNAYGKVDVQLHLFLTTSLNELRNFALMRGSVGPIAGLDIHPCRKLDSKCSNI